MKAYLSPLTALVLGAAVLAGCQTPQPVTPSLLSASPAPEFAADKQIAVGASPHGITALSGVIYNSNTGAGAESISVIDAASEAVTKTLTIEGAGPNYQKAFHDGKHALVIDKKRSLMLVIDPGQDHKVIQSIALGAGPDKVVIADDDRTAIVSLTDEAKLLHFTFDADRAKPPVRKAFAVGNVTAGQFKHRSVDFHGDWAVVPNSGDNNVHLINLTSGESKVVADGTSPGPVGIGTLDGRAKVAIVGNTASNTITLFDLPTGEKTTLDGVGLAPGDILVDDELGRAFVTMSGSNEVAVIDYLNKRVVGRLSAGKRPVHIYKAPPLPEASGYAVSHSGVSHEFWVGNDDGDSVSVYDGAGLKAVATVTTGKGHHKMAFSGTKAYVSNLTAGTVSMIDRTKLPRTGH